MANHNANAIAIDQQPGFESPYGQTHGLSDVALVSLRIAERMSILSEGVVNAADDGESYESLVRQIRTLHDNLANLSNSCNQALHEHGFYRASDSNQLKLID